MERHVVMGSNAAFYHVTLKNLKNVVGIPHSPDAVANSSTPTVREKYFLFVGYLKKCAFFVLPEQRMAR